MLAQLAARGSPAERLNPLFKLVTLFLAVLVLILTREPAPTLYVATLALLLNFVLGRVRPGDLLRGTAPFAGLALGLAWINAVSGAPGEPSLVSLGPLRVSVASLTLGLTLGLRVYTVVLISYFIAATTDPRALALSMVHQARLPYPVAFGLFLGFRFLYQLTEELQTIRAAHRLRGAGQPGGRLAALRQQTLALMAGIVARSGSMGRAMEARAYGARPTRTYLDETRVGPADWIFLAGLLLLVIGGFYLLARLGLLTGLGLQLGTPYQQLR